MLACFSKDFETILNANEISQDVVYKRYENNEEHKLKAVIVRREFETTQDEGRLALDAQIAYIATPFVPKYLDTLSVNDITYSVKSYEVQVSRYKLVLEANKRTTNAHTMGRYR